MMSKKTSVVSALLILVMVASAFALPALSDDFTVNGATKKVKVKFYANGGKFTKKKDSKKKSINVKVVKGEKLGSLPSVKKTGYKLKGWYTKKVKGTKYTKSKKVNKAVKLYAQWKAETYMVFFTANGDASVSPIRVTYDKAYGKLPVPVKSGYEFLGWFTSENGGVQVTETTIYKTADNSRLYAHWKQL